MKIIATRPTGTRPNVFVEGLWDSFYTTASVQSSVSPIYGCPLCMPIQRTSPQILLLSKPAWRRHAGIHNDEQKMVPSIFSVPLIACITCICLLLLLLNVRCCLHGRESCPFRAEIPGTNTIPWQYASPHEPDNLLDGIIWYAISQTPLTFTNSVSPLIQRPCPVLHRG